jgi:hypothetical protein
MTKPAHRSTDRNRRENTADYRLMPEATVVLDKQKSHPRLNTRAAGVLDVVTSIYGEREKMKQK